MKKNKVLIILVLIFILQFAVPLSVMGMREIAENSGLQGKIKVGAWYYEEDYLLDLSFDKKLRNNIYSSDGYTPVHLDENGYIVSSGNTKLKPSGPYLSYDKVNRSSTEFEKERINLLVSEKELHDILLKVVYDESYSTKQTYVTASVFEGELFLKELWVDDTKLLEFLY